MVFGFNNFNMMNMFPMNFGSFGFGSFGCGTGYSNFGSSLFGCGFGNNYLNPTNCDGSTNWGAVGFGLTAAFAPVLFAGVTRLVAGAVQNSNGNQQEVVADDIQVLQGRVDDALAELGSGVTVENYEEYNIDTKEPSYQKAIDAATSAFDKANDEIGILNGNGNGSIKSLEEDLATLKNADPKDNKAIEAKEKEIADAKHKLLDLKADVAEPNGKLYKAKAEAEKAKADRVEAIRLQKIKIEKAIEELRNAQAELEELRLDDYDGTAIQRTRQEDFNKNFTLNKDDQGNLTNITYSDINKVKKSDILYIINQYKTATPENKQKWALLLHNLWKDNLNADIRKGDCLAGYKLICEELKAHIN